MLPWQGVVMTCDGGKSNEAIVDYGKVLVASCRACYFVLASLLQVTVHTNDDVDGSNKEAHF